MKEEKSVEEEHEKEKGEGIGGKVRRKEKSCQGGKGRKMSERVGQRRGD